ncbi:neuroglobin-like [Varroa jacobsoni]|uniref:Globin domain-containing protein n=1 Tax=Varroa destructor TaxID=109461 RepID=A0A7M7MAF3_VARDE|nr:neuroglobin-like [Varroa destructor]XP_022647718.1 neuroglobin-like [Varroa destructor]XP_022647727.1 neuroglobin-like [Varroa destructor]XP_022647736.1 neuroglobin-like [Varroa destructor]XP_022647743.1 neuroglobin-like [Varroa destructor]XP_022647751.1 neuroglobin-like [Varroa destructor]XP_022688178.1 neuroglobin-like [Varroa jacobsoni]
MGCTLSKAVTSLVHKGSERSPGVGRVADVDDPPPPPPPDPRSPLTARQIFSISKSWKAIARAMEPTGVEMFVRLFKQNEELLELFTSFQALKTEDEQRESMELGQHASLVMTTLDEGINSLDNLDYFFDYLHNAGGLHYKIKGFKKDYFWLIEKPFLEAVKLTLGDRYTDNIENIYKTTIHFILETLIEGYDMAEKKAIGSH